MQREKIAKPTEEARRFDNASVRTSVRHSESGACAREKKVKKEKKEKKEKKSALDDYDIEMLDHAGFNDQDRLFIKVYKKDYFKDVRKWDIKKISPDEGPDQDLVFKTNE